MPDGKDVILNSGNDSILFAHKAFKFIENKEYEQALELCESGVKRFPFYAEGHFILGKCYQSLKKYEEAKSEYERTLMFMPGHIRALNALAYVYFKLQLAPKANDLLILASLYNPLNHELMEYLKSENLYDPVYGPAGGENESADTVQAKILTDEPEYTDDTTRELITEINELIPKSSGDDTDNNLLTDAPVQDWEKEADKIEARELLPFDLSGDESEEADSQLDEPDAEEILLDQDDFSDLSDDSLPEMDNLPEQEEPSGDEFDSIESELNDISELDANDAESGQIKLEDSSIDDSFLDDSFIQDSSEDEFFLEPEDLSDLDESDEEITRIDEYASSKDENTEISIDQYEVNNIVDNIVEADMQED
ncbi:MAG: tetratricopeptide repeat protein, partial [Calditrichaceae bacterium]